MNIILDLTPPIFCILLCVGCGIGWFFWKRFNWSFRYWLIPVFLCYMLLLINLTLFPVYLFDKATLDSIWGGMGGYFTPYQLIPFASIKDYFQTGARLQFVGNVLLLAPLSVFAEIFLQQRHKAWKMILGTGTVSVLIEITQLALNLMTGHPGRVIDVDDLILNISGAVITIILTRLVCKNQKICNILRRVLYR